MSNFLCILCFFMMHRLHFCAQAKLMKFWLTFSLMRVCAILFWKTSRGCSASERNHSSIDHYRIQDDSLSWIPVHSFCHYLWLPRILSFSHYLYTQTKLMKFWLTFSLMSIYAILFWKTPRGAGQTKEFTVWSLNLVLRCTKCKNGI